MAPGIDDRAACAYDVLNVFLSSNADRATYSLQALPIFIYCLWDYTMNFIKITIALPLPIVY